MIVIVGHGPSILSGLGSVIDSHTVVRLKHGRMREAKNWGTRTDYLCGRSRSFEKPGVPFWFFGGELERKWVGYYAAFQPRSRTLGGEVIAKPSHGLCAAFCAVEYLGATELAFIGCDTLLDPDKDFCKWWGRPTFEDQAEYEAIHGTPWVVPHDWRAENEALHALGVRIIDLTGDSHGCTDDKAAQEAPHEGLRVAG